mgnify:CR=1 FL=1
MISANNAVYWMQNPLESAELSILRDIECGINGFPKHKQFAAAHLIALECVEPDFDKINIKDLPQTIERPQPSFSFDTDNFSSKSIICELKCLNSFAR